MSGSDSTQDSTIDSGRGRAGDGTTSVDEPLPAHRRPEGVDDATVEALGKLSEAPETSS